MEKDTKGQIKERLGDYKRYWGTTYNQVADDLQYESGKQIKQSTDGESDRQYVVINQIRRYTNRLVNPTILNPYSSDLSAIDKEMDPVAKALDQEIDRVLKSDDHREAIEVAYRTAVISGYGYWKVNLKDTRYGQKLVIEPVLDPTSIYIDPYAQSVDGCDAEDAMSITWIDKAVAKRKYGANAAMDGVEWEDSMYSSWSRKDENSVPEVIYYQKKYKTKNVSVLADGTETDQPVDDFMNPVVETKTDTVTYIEITKYIGEMEVAKSRMDIPYIPIVMVSGDMDRSDGKLKRSGIVKLAKTSQDILNYYATSEIELAGVAPRPTWVMPFGADEGFEESYNQANRKNFAKLYYNQYDDRGQPLQAPVFTPRVVTFDSYINGRNKSEMDISNEIGIGDTNFGDLEGSAQSGRSVFLRQMQGEMSTIHYQSNLEKSIKQTVRILIDLLSIVSKSVAEFEMEDPQSGEVIKQQVPLTSIDFSCDDFEIDLTSGPLNESRRQFGVSQMLEVAQASGNFALIADLIAEQMDIPNSREIADRFRKSLPPGIIEEDGVKEPDPEAVEALNQAQQTIGELETQNEQLWQYVQQLQAQLISDSETNRSKEAIEQMKIEKDLAIAEIKAEVERYKVDQSTEIKADQLALEAEKSAAQIVETRRKDSEAREDKIIDTLTAETNTQATGPQDINPVVAGPVDMPE